MAKEFLANVELGEENIRESVIEFMPYSFEIANKAALKCY